VQLSVLKAIAE